MRIFTPDTDEVHDKVMLFLTAEELQHLSATALGILDEGGHNHVYDVSFQKEIIIASIDKQSMETYDDRSLQVIAEDK